MNTEYKAGSDAEEVMIGREEMAMKRCALLDEVVTHEKIFYVCPHNTTIFSMVCVLVELFLEHNSAS